MAPRSGRAAPWLLFASVLFSTPHACRLVPAHGELAVGGALPPRCPVPATRLGAAVNLGDRGLNSSRPDAAAPRGFRVQELEAELAATAASEPGALDDLPVPHWLSDMRAKLERGLPRPCLVFPGTALSRHARHGRLRPCGHCSCARRRPLTRLAPHSVRRACASAGKSDGARAHARVVPAGSPHDSANASIGTPHPSLRPVDWQAALRGQVRYRPCNHEDALAIMLSEEGFA